MEHKSLLHHLSAKIVLGLHVPQSENPSPGHLQVLHHLALTTLLTSPPSRSRALPSGHVLECAEHVPLDPSHLLCPLPGVVFTQTSPWLPLSLPLDFFKYYFLSESFPGFLIKISASTHPPWCSPTPFLLFFSPWHISICRLTYLSYLLCVCCPGL